MELDDKVSTDLCNKVDGLTIGDSAEIDGNLTWLNDACLSGSIKTKQSFWKFYRLPKSPEVHVSPFLSRPVRVAGGTVGAAPAAFYTQALNVAFLQTAGGLVNFANKLAGYAAIRCTWCFRINFSNTPFVGGQVRLVHQPPALNYTGLSGTLPRAATRQWPGVEMDLNTQTACEFKVPHRNMVPYFRLFDTTATDANGTVIFSAYNGPTFIAPTVAPDFEVWFWIEDVELVGIKANTADLVIATPTSGKGMGVKPSMGEITGSGPISGFLGATARLSMWAGTMIPALSAVAAPISWVARVGQKVAAAFGYSRPLNQLVIRDVKSKEWSYLNNATGVLSAYNTGIQHDAALPVIPFVGDEEDALSIPFLVSQWHYMGNFSLASQVDGALIAKGALNPLALYTQTGQSYLTPFERNATWVTPFPALWPSSAMGVAQYFSHWRGGFKLRLIFGKTKFHTGRLLFGWDYNPYSPVTTDATTVPAYASTVYNERKVIDLREGNVFEVEIPYFAALPFLSMSTCMGSWYLYVVDPLKFSGQVLNSVPIIVEACMTTDTLFNGPRDSAFYYDDNFVGQVFASSGATPSRPVDLEAALIGDDISSLKQLAMRPVPRSTLVGGQDLWFEPLNARAATVFDYNNKNSVLGWIRRIFALERGSMVHTLIPTSDANYAAYSAYRFINGDSLSARTTTNSSYIVGKNDLFHSTIVQRYAPLGATYNNLGTLPVSDGLARPQLLRYLNARGAETNSALVSVGDDFGAFVFKGTVPLVPRQAGLISLRAD